MNFKILLFSMISILLFSCRGEDMNDLQKIDQVVNLYISDTNGVDLLNTENTNAYKTVTLQDLNDPNTALKAISTFSIKKDLNNVSYIDYAGGATRVLQTTSGQYPEIYQSEFYINLTKSVNDNDVTDVDTIKIQYSSEPSQFKVSKIWYNKQLAFSKVSVEPNIVKIVK
jgi:hypothetical protein